jgi:hypothetical protein
VALYRRLRIASDPAVLRMTACRMDTLVRATRFVALSLTLLIVCGVSCLRAEEAKPPLCTEDAMIVFDASGSMYGD